VPFGERIVCCGVAELAGAEADSESAALLKLLIAEIAEKSLKPTWFFKPRTVPLLGRCGSYQAELGNMRVDLLTRASNPVELDSNGNT
jgi:hypothetical protein